MLPIQVHRKDNGHPTDGCPLPYILIFMSYKNCLVSYRIPFVSPAVSQRLTASSSNHQRSNKACNTPGHTHTGKDDIHLEVDMARDGTDLDRQD